MFTFQMKQRVPSPVDSQKLPRLSDNYRIIEAIGSGTYGQVSKAVSTHNPLQIMSIKQAKIVREDRLIPSSIFRELALLNEIHFPHIIHPSIYDVFCDYDDKMLSFAYEYAACDVRKLIRSYARTQAQIPIVAIKSILYQLLLALDHLHKRSIVHCDITPSNLVLMPTTSRTPGILKVIDFGLSRIIEDIGADRNTGVVTVWYRAPELLLGDRRYNTAVDIWSAGCIFGELAYGNVLFATQKKGPEQDPTAFNWPQIERIQEVMGPINASDFGRQDRLIHFTKFSQMSAPPLKSDLRKMMSSLSQSGFDLLMKMLTYDPEKRITAHDALRHPFFNEAPIPAMNIARLIPKEEWTRLSQIDSKGSEA